MLPMISCKRIQQQHWKDSLTSWQLLAINPMLLEYQLNKEVQSKGYCDGHGA